MKSEEKQRPFKGKFKTRDKAIEQKHNFSGSEGKTMARPNNAKTCFELSLHYRMAPTVTATSCGTTKMNNRRI